MNEQWNEQRDRDRKIYERMKQQKADVQAARDRINQLVRQFGSWDKIPKDLIPQVPTLGAPVVDDKGNPTGVRYIPYTKATRIRMQKRRR